MQDCVESAVTRRARQGGDPGLCEVVTIEPLRSAGSHTPVEEQRNLTPSAVRHKRSGNLVVAHPESREFDHERRVHGAYPVVELPGAHSVDGTSDTKEAAVESRHGVDSERTAGEFVPRQV